VVESREEYRGECGSEFGDWMLGKVLAVCDSGMKGEKSSTYQWLSRSYSNGQWRVGETAECVFAGRERRTEVQMLKHSCRVQGQSRQARVVKRLSTQRTESQR
jgi:ribosomal protein L44E